MDSSMYVYSHFSHDRITRINLLHKMWCNIQKNDHLMATYIDVPDDDDGYLAVSLAGLTIF
jgi:hypothetical protein